MSEAADNLIDPIAEASYPMPVSVIFDGIIEGACEDYDSLEQATHRLSRAHPPSFDTSFEGNRCSLLVDNQTHIGSSFTAEHWDLLDQHLQEVVDLLGGEDEIDLTLRCTERHQDHLRETLFLIDGKKLRRISRQRPLPEPEPGPADADRIQHRIRPAAIIALLFILLGILLIWQNGLIWRLMPKSGSSVHIEAGACAALIKPSISESWGHYHITLTRGPQYPSSPSELTRSVDAAKTLSDRALLTLVADGGDICVILEDSSGKPLSTALVSLRPLLLSTQGRSSCDLPGDERTASLRLALDAPSPSP